MKKISLFLVAALTLGLLMVLSPARAAETSGIQISPVTLNFDIKPGATETSKVTVVNRNTEPLDYVLETELFSDSSEDGVPSFEAIKAIKGVSSLSDWITFTDGTTGTIAAKGSKEINFTIATPTDVDPGGHYGAIFVKQIKTTGGSANQVTVAARVGTLVLVSIPGEVTKSAEIVEFKAPKIIWKGPVNLQMRVKNTGTVHYDSKGAAELKPLWGAVTNLEMGEHTILPKGIRAFEATWQKKYPFGYYSITPTATDGDKNVMSGAVVTMWAIPLVIVIPILIAIFVLIMIIVYIRRHVRIVKQ